MDGCDTGEATIRSKRRKQSSPRKNLSSADEDEAHIIENLPSYIRNINDLADTKCTEPGILGYDLNESVNEQSKRIVLNFNSFASDDNLQLTHNEAKLELENTRKENSKRKPALQCPKCMKQFSKDKHLDVHQLIGHQTKTRHKCLQCNLSFPFYSLLASHIKKTHRRVSGLFSIKSEPGKLSQVKLPFDVSKTVYMYKESHGKPLFDSNLMVLRDPTNSTDCFCCQLPLCGLKEIKDHFETQHRDWNYKLICPHCLRCFRKISEVDQHKRSKRRRCMKLTGLLCKPCNITFELPELFISHMQESHSKYEARYQCPICTVYFRQPYYRKRHMAIKHGIHRESELNSEYKSAFAPANCTMQSVHMCVYCQRRFPSGNSLKLHFLRMHVDREGRNGKKKNYCCLKCPSKEFGSLLEKNRHINQVHKDWQCPHCSLKFAQRSKMARHMESHLDQKLQCSLCTTEESLRKTYATAANLRNHIRRVHTDEYKNIYGFEVKGRTYDCEVCGKKCPSIGDYRKHMRVHTNERPFKCNHCPSAFKQSRHVKEHMMYKHKAEYEAQYGEIQYKHHCDECDKKFLAKCALTKHKRAHARQKKLEACRESPTEASPLPVTSAKKKRARGSSAPGKDSSKSSTESAAGEGNHSSRVENGEAYSSHLVEIVDVIKIEPRGYSDDEF